MKKMNKTLQTITILTAIFFTYNLQAQQAVCLSDSGKVVAKWKELSNNPGWRVLEKELNQKGFKQINYSSFMTGIQVGPKKEFYAYDFYDGKGKAASMIYRNNGTNEYIAYIILGKGSDWESQLEAGEEYYSDKTAVIKKANSWKSCFKKCAKNTCKSWCLGSIAPCAAAAIGLAAATAGMTAPMAIGVFFGCAGGSCLGCFAVCAVGCD